MQYNIFKIKDKKDLLENMLTKGYEKCGTQIESGNYRLNLYCKYKKKKKIGWKSVFDAFGESNIPNKSGVAGIVICDEKNDNIYIDIFERFVEEDELMVHIASNNEIEKFRDNISKFNIEKER